MFSLVSGVYQAYWAPQQVNLLVVGAQGAGKTSLLERIKVTDFDSNNKKTRANRTAADISIEGKPLPADIVRGQSVPCDHNSHSNKLKSEHDKKPTVRQRSTTPIRRDQNKVASATPQSQQQQQHPPARRGWVCPSPAKYSQAVVDDSDDEEEYVDDTTEDDSHVAEPLVPSPGELNERGESLESVELDVKFNQNQKNETTKSTAGTKSTAATGQSNTNTKKKKKTKEYDLKPNAKMLPMEKIRPTIGMNLGKVDICGAKCRVWDLGGRLQNLWERYYDDCDAVIFVWKLGGGGASHESNEEQQPYDEHDHQDNNDTNKKEEDEDDDAPPPITVKQQVALLEQVRKAIPDDVPFLVLVHYWEDTPSGDFGQLTDQRFTTTPYLLPNYHNPFQALFLGNAQTGQGVRSAMDWLITLAKQQVRVREKSSMPPTAK